MVNLACPQAQRPATPLLGLSLLLHLPSTLLLCRRPPSLSGQRPRQPSGLSYPSPQGAIPTPPPPPHYVKTPHTSLPPPRLHRTQSVSSKTQGTKTCPGWEAGSHSPVPILAQGWLDFQSETGDAGQLAEATSSEGWGHIQWLFSSSELQLPIPQGGWKQPLLR